jgi:N-acetylglucosamine kinase-like BadF-type ATPase
MVRGKLIDYVLGLDGGGSKTTIQIADTDGKVLIQNKSGSCNYKSVGREIAENNINEVILDSLEKIGIPDIIFKSACFGLAGNDTDEDMQIYKKIIFNERIKKFLNPSSTIICNDSKIGLIAGSNKKNRLMVICGTGVNCFGINEDGREAKTNGWDYILGDEGSGYSIGLKALKAIVRAHDGRGRDTLLTDMVLDYLKLKDISGLVSWVYEKPFFKEKVADLAEIVCSAAKMGDSISMEILSEEAGEAASSVMVVVDKLDLADKDFDLVPVGGVFKCEKYFKSLFFKILKNKFQGINFKSLTEKPVEGAIKLALENLLAAK